jgi:hypothetical protein
LYLGVEGWVQGTRAEEDLQAPWAIQEEEHDPELKEHQEVTSFSPAWAWGRVDLPCEGLREN